MMEEAEATPLSATRDAVRSRRLAVGVATSLLARALTLAAPLLLIPVTYRYFGAAQFGLWATITSLTSMVLWADLGLGNGLLTRLTPLLAAGNIASARAVISAAYSTLTAVSAILLGLLFLSMGVVPWASILGLEDAAHVNATTAICFGIVLLNIPLSLIQRVQFAAQEVAHSSVLQIIAPTCSVVGALVGVWIDAPYLAVVAVIAIGPLVSFSFATYVFYSRTPQLRPVPVSPFGPQARAMVLVGLGFLVVQVFSSVAMNLDLPIASHLLNDDELAEFGVTVRLFLVLGALVSVVSLPLWPANGEAMANGDTAWVKKTTLRMCLWCAGAVGIAGGLIMLLGDFVLPWVLGEGFEANVQLMASLTAMWILVAIGSPLFMVQNAAGALRPQLLGWPIFFVTSAIGKVVAGSAWGADVIPLVGAVAYGLILLPVAFLGFSGALRSATERNGQV